ncbi:phage antirepressor KilAC domain-containing protein [Microbacterium sp. PAMC21962]|uniref:phage antirepressor KilAC domain-containing protein n=1 Tax=Microbacterium sp. PAMC21962 TaxID=2861280 RepID=UPI001C6333BE|nr:phage antirepressor KilAC domain-containing protein [Microbacterium sp. PAMC21962]QYF98933.1 phage antirepressor KilAC domain-containing protein [Microbacterium sp. PAMC21962]
MSAVVELSRTRTKLIHRMPGAGDLWIFVDAGAMFMRADQVEAIAGIPPWSTGELLVEAGTWETIDGHVCYPVEVAIARCEAAATPPASRFLDWVRTVLEATDDDALDKAQLVPSFIGSHPVHVAARILSEDPEVTIGRNGLFEVMHQAGWLDRSGGDWTVTHVARRNGWLTVRNIPVPGRGRTPYPQTYVTPAGLVELQRLLTAGRRHSPPEPAQHPTLFD